MTVWYARLRFALIWLTCRVWGHDGEIVEGTEGTPFETEICERCALVLDVYDGRVMT